MNQGLSHYKGMKIQPKWLTKWLIVLSLTQTYKTIKMYCTMNSQMKVITKKIPNYVNKYKNKFEIYKYPVISNIC